MNRTFAATSGLMALVAVLIIIIAAAALAGPALQAMIETVAALAAVLS